MGYYARLVEVIDADTLVVEAKTKADIADTDVEATREFTLRLRDVDTHEDETKQGQKEKEFVKQFLTKQQQGAYYDYPFEVYPKGQEWEKGGYGRLLGGLRDTEDRDLEMVLMQKFDNILYEPKYGDDKKDERQDQ